MAPSFLQTALVASAAIGFLSSTVSAQSSPAATATTAPKSITTLDCYKNAYPLVQQGSYTFQTSGYCQVQCANMHKPVMAITEGSTCFCGDELPPSTNKVADSSCNTPCNGFDQQTCGGNGFWQFYLTGLTNDVDTASNSNNPSSTGGDGQSSTSASPSVITKAGQTVVVTASASASSGSGKGGGSSKVGIAVGVIVGLMAIAGIVGGIVLFLKRRRRLAIEEEHRRNAAASSFISSKVGSLASDQRLDPSINSHLRQSIGSIADERDFSRRILQVRNPDRDSKASNLA